MKRKSKKPTHSFFGNTAFMFRTIGKWDKSLVPLNVVYDVFNAMGELCTASFATALTYCIENQTGLSSIIIVTLAVSVIHFTMYAFCNVMWQKIESKRVQVHRSFEILLGEKVMDMDFDLHEGPFGREKYQKAKNALSQGGVYGFLEQYGALFTMLLLTVIYGSATIMLSPWLILILTGLEVLKLISVALESKLINKTKDPIARTDRHLNYVNRVSRDFSSAKDIRLYRLREYLMHMSQYFIGERKFWTQKMYFYYFCTDMMYLVLSVSIEIGIFAYIIYSTLHGNMSVTELVFYVFTVTEFTGFLDEVGANIVGCIQINMEIGNMREFLDIKNIARNSGGKPLPTEFPYEIELQNVSFTYPECKKPTLKNINLKLKKGERLALVGVNGAGKTTLVKILCGLYRPTEGRVLVNGTDIAEFNRDDYYKEISAVFQDPRFLPCTILENVTMLPADESDREKFFDCIKKAGLYSKILSLEQKENTPLVKTVNEKAVELSGGEMQRLLLARAIYKDAPVLVLDEPTAALDPLAEHEIYSRFNEMVKDKTAVYISHRLSSCRFCDRILVFDDAKLIQDGSHEKLLENPDGKYSELWNAQAVYYAADSDGSPLIEVDL